MKTKINQYMLDSFMSNVNKLSIWGSSQTANDPIFGKVTIVRSAADSKLGKREFSVSKSNIKSGRYTFAGLKNAFAKTVTIGY